MQIIITVEKSFGQLLHDLGFKFLCDGIRSYPVNSLDSKIIEKQLVKKQTLNFSVYTNKKDKIGRNFLTNPGVFMPPNAYYFFKEARYCPEEKTFIVRVNIIKSFAQGISLGKGYEKEILVQKIRSSIADLSGGVFERLYRTTDSAISEAYTICK